MTDRSHKSFPPMVKVNREALAASGPVAQCFRVCHPELVWETTWALCHCTIALRGMSQTIISYLMEISPYIAKNIALSSTSALNLTITLCILLFQESKLPIKRAQSPVSEKIYPVNINVQQNLNDLNLI